MIQIADFLTGAMSRKSVVKVAKKAKACKCLVCEQPVGSGKRGLCDCHYFQFDYARSKCSTKRERIEFEAKHIQEGKVLPSVRGRHGKSNPFMN
jgi:hypothetical protein